MKASINAALILTVSLSLSLTLTLVLNDVSRQGVARAEPTAQARHQGPVGILKRTAWTTSKITGSPEPPLPYRTERVFPKLTFQRPIAITTIPVTERLLVVENQGPIYCFPNDQEVTKPDLFFNLAEGIEDYYRTYGIAFHPDYSKNRYVYLCYVLKKEQPEGTRVSRFVVRKSDPPAIDPKSEKIILTWQSGGHNGGCLKFGPDGYLYISSGDGASPSPPDRRDTGQDIGDLLSSVLRIDVDHPEEGKPYGIPQDNPFVNTPGARPEVWAYGFRNPWKMSFDPRSGDLWLGDVGWELWEMIYRLQPGGNYGWSIKEGPKYVRPETAPGPTPILPPTAQHSHIESRSITGGQFYYGKRLPELVGAYVYGDYVTGKLWALRHDGQQVTWQQELADSALQVIAFGEDTAGELFVLDYSGTINRLVPNPSGGLNRDFPKTLSQTGLFASVADHTMAPGVIPYSINAEPWADHGIAQRFLALPGKTKLRLFTKEEHNVQVGNVAGQWKYPNDAVLVKTISLEMQLGNPASRRAIETQILHRDGDTWRAYTFAWNEEQSDGALVPPEGLDRSYTIVDANAPGGRRRQTWHFASRSECIVCHTTRAGTIHGFNVEQLNKQHDYGTVADQLATLAHLGIFEQPLPDHPERRPDPFDPSLDLEQRARSYLHVNCAHCHRRGGGGNAPFELRYELPLETTGVLGVRPLQGTFGIHGAQVVAPGDPYRSILFYRMAKLGRGRMPYAGSGMVDQRGLDLIEQWIREMPIDLAGEPTSPTIGKQEAAALQKITSSGGKASQEAVDRLLSTTSGALRLLRAADAGTLPANVAAAVIARAKISPDAGVRDLFERFVPEEQRIQRLGSVIRPEAILERRGNVDRGRQVFFNTTGVQCKQCHRIGKEGTEVGPDLSQIGKKYDRAQLLESILEPSKKIDPKFVSYLLESSDGRLYTGLLVDRTDEHVILKDAQNKQIRVAADEVDLLVPQQKSLMPELLLRDMTAEQVADMLEFLASLK